MTESTLELVLRLNELLLILEHCSEYGAFYTVSVWQVLALIGTQRSVSFFF